MQPVLIGIGAYLVVQFVVGMLVSRSIASEADYLVAGRRLGLALAAFSVYATWFGAETIVGAAGTIYSDGLAGGSADPFGYAACLIVLGVFIAAPLWRRQYTTLGDMFRERYSVGVERLGVLLMVPTSVLWAAAQIRAFGQVVTATSADIEVEIAIGAAAFLVIVYTMAGGLLADVVTDFIQGIAIIVGLLVLIVVVAQANGGFAELSSLIDPQRLALFSTERATPLEIVEAWAVPICGSLLAAELLSRILGCNSAATARNATLLGAGIYLVIGLIPVAIGLAGPALVPGLEEPEQVVVALAQRHLSTFLYILFAGAVISAILSTVNSCLLAAAALVSHNVVVPLMPSIDERGKVRCARIGVVLFGIAAYALALGAEGIYELVATASAFGSAGIFVVGIFGLFSRVGGAPSAHAALVSGMVVWAAGEYWLEWSTPYIAAVAAAFAAYLAVAAIAPRATA